MLSRDFFFKKHPRFLLILLNLALLILIFTVAESLLRIRPYYFATIGHNFSDKFQKYGWGFYPGELIRTRNPDSGDIYISFANNHGWRDLDREYDNKNGSFRILVLGDSVTFGAIIPDDKIYTRVLEKKLTEAGYNAEVISMAYGGWGTDQELEALINEGIKYKPNLIIVQFTTNDITDNAYFYYALVGIKGWVEKKGCKPFYYKLDSERAILRRKINPFFNCQTNLVRKGLKNIIFHSEILKRLYALYISHYLGETPNLGSEDDLKNMAAIKRCIRTHNQLNQLQLVINLKKESNLYKYLYDHENKILSFRELNGIIDSSEYKARKDIILRICEDRWFHKYYSKEYYFFKPVDTSSYEWRLLFALLEEIKNKATSINADVAIFNETGEGRYQFDRFWYRVSQGDIYKINFLSHIPALRIAAKERGIDFIENTKPYVSGRNDPHPNIEGNAAMADDIWQYLMRSKSGELATFRNDGNGCR
jgi:lysophospholipase L1-like esterase